MILYNWDYEIVKIKNVNSKHDNFNIYSLNGQSINEAIDTLNENKLSWILCLNKKDIVQYHSSDGKFVEFNAEEYEVLSFYSNKENDFEDVVQNFELDNFKDYDVVLTI